MFRFATLVLLIFSLSLPVSSHAEDDRDRPFEHKIEAKFDIERGRIYGRSSVFLHKGKGTVMRLDGLSIKSASVNGLPIIVDTDMTELAFEPSQSDNKVVIEYEAEFRPGAMQANHIGPDGVTLLSGWYPVIENPVLFSLTAFLPSSFEAASEADEVSVSAGSDETKKVSFRYAYPLDGIHMIAGPYSVTSYRHAETEIYLYLRSPDQQLADMLADTARSMLDRYTSMLGPYPYKRLGIIDHTLTMDNLATFCTVDLQTLGTDSAFEAAVGRGVLGQWLGGIVRVQRGGGDWASPLKIYLSDHLIEEKRGTGAEFRRNLLRLYQSYVTPDNDMALTACTGRETAGSAAAACRRGALVFHMLRRLTGDEAFFSAIRDFTTTNIDRSVSWGEIRKSFETVSGRKLDNFFGQWLRNKGVIDFDLKNGDLSYRGSTATVSVDLVRKGEPYSFQLPVTLASRDGQQDKTFDIDKETTRLSIETSDDPLELIIDREYDLLRRLTDNEFPPQIDRLIGNSKKLFVLPRDKSAEYGSVAEYLGNNDFVAKKEEDITFEDIKTSSLLVPGSDTEIVKRLFGKTELRRADFSVSVTASPFNKNGVIAVFEARPTVDVVGHLKRLRDFGNAATVAFNPEKKPLFTVADAQKGIRIEVEGDITGIEVPRLTGFDDVVNKIMGKKIVYIGEAHDKFEHHRAQFRLIRALYRKNNRLAIGMEMFQRPFQAVIDEYISGTIDEREFLKKSEYYKRWGFDYSLYREILLFAKENKIPVIALNIRKEIISKVSKEGIYALKEDDRKDLPAFMNLSDDEYRSRLRDIFGRHRGADQKSFDFFYQSQVIWDETMAQSIDDFLKREPDRQMVVIAGGGHLQYGSGIPMRAFSLNGLDYAVVLNSDDVDKNIADYVLMPGTVPYQEPPKLMLQLTEEAGRLKVTGFPSDSVSEKAGLEKDDILLELDAVSVKGMDDIKIALLYKKRGDAIAVRVLRNRILFGPDELLFNVRL